MRFLISFLQHLYGAGTMLFPFHRQTPCCSEPLSNLPRFPQLGPEAPLALKQVLVHILQ